MPPRPLVALRSIGWPAWLASTVLFALLCAIVAYWTMQMLAPRAPIAPAVSAVEQRALPELQLASQLFGVTQSAGPVVAPPSNIQVLGVVAAGPKGSAILTVDGGAPKAVAVGERVTPTQVVQAVRSDAVVIDAGGQRSELPAPARPSTDLLTSGVGRARSTTGRGGAPGAPAASAPPGGIVPVAPAPMPAPAVQPSEAGGIVPVPPPGMAAAGAPGALPAPPANAPTVGKAGADRPAQ
jgi:general secretion pathway protein C